MSHIGNIINGETGASVRGKLNELIAATNSQGWANYTDTSRTSANPVDVVEGATVNIINDGLNSITAYLPQGSAGFYNGTRITPDASGDTYSVRIALQAYTSSNSGAFNISMDISAAGDGSNTITSKPVRMVRGTGVGNVQLYTIDFPIFALGTFLSNGAVIRLESLTGTTSYYGVSYVIVKTNTGLITSGN